MFKKLTCIIMSVLILTSCTKQAPAKTDNISTSQEVSINKQLVNLRLVTSDEEYSTMGNGNENGYYYIQQGEGISGNIKYIDYAGATDIYLSSNVTENRNSPED